MRCPYCDCQDSKVVDSRDVDDSIRRRRECLAPGCNGRFTTYEQVQRAALYVVKKDGRREEFSRAKLASGLRKACDKRPLAAGAIDRLAAEIEQALFRLGVPEVPSNYVGEIVMGRLRDLDPIAYVRFASVYREFADIEALREELEALSSASSRPAGAQLPLLDEAELSPTSLRLRPAAPISRTRSRRPVRPVQTPTPLQGPESVPGEEPKRRRKAR